MRKINSFFEIIKKYKGDKNDKDIFDIIDKSLSNQEDYVKIARKLISKLGLPFKMATSLAYEMQKIKLSTDDLDEIRDEMNKEEEVKYSPLLLTNELISKIDYNISNVNIRKRFDQTVLSWFKGIRDDLELKDALTKAEKIGGVGMSEDVYDKLLGLLREKKKEVEAKGLDIRKIIGEYEQAPVIDYAKKAEPVEQEIDVTAKANKIEITPETMTGTDLTMENLTPENGLSYDSLARKEEIKEELKEQAQRPVVQEVSAIPFVDEIEAEQEFLEQNEELEPPAEEAVVEQVDPPVYAPENVNQEVNLEEQAPLNTVAETQEVVLPQTPQTSDIKPPLFNRNEPPSSKPRVEDVKFTFAVYGPIEELGVMSLNDFRRLSSDPKEAVIKISDKIGLLEDESYEKKAQGIRALKSSPLYKLYADIMNQAMMSGEPIAKVIEKNPLMRVAEFEAIREINKLLKY